MFSASAGLVVTLVAHMAQAHMYIRSPEPIPGSAPKDPLDPSGSNFPCHGVSFPSSGGQQMAAGSSQLLAWELEGGYNTAVHGGGSCQISITYETDPEKIKDPSNWYVIYSILGGCPSNTAGNLDGQYTGPAGSYSGALDCSDPKANGVDCVNSFNFTIPKGVKSGHATLSWSWFNTIGNREFYHNCVSADLTGGDGSEMSEFPSMFVANLASVDSCPTTEQTNVDFPYPGKYVTTKLPSGPNAKQATIYKMAKPSGGSCASDGAPVGGDAAAPPAYTGGASPPAASASEPAAPSYGGSAPSGSAPAASAPPAAPSASAVAPSGSYGGGLVTVTTMQTVTSGSAAGSSAAAGSSSAAPSAPAYGGSSAAAAAPSSAAAPSGYTPPSATGSSSSSGSCANGAVACSVPGAVVCIGSDQFGLCNINNCAVPQALSAGTHCTNGEIRKRDLKEGHVRRHVHGPRHGPLVRRT